MTKEITGEEQGFNEYSADIEGDVCRSDLIANNNAQVLSKSEDQIYFSPYFQQTPYASLQNEMDVALNQQDYSSGSMYLTEFSSCEFIFIIYSYSLIIF